MSCPHCGEDELSYILPDEHSYNAELEDGEIDIDWSFSEMREAGPDQWGLWCHSCCAYIEVGHNMMVLPSYVIGDLDHVDEAGDIIKNVLRHLVEAKLHDARGNKKKSEKALDHANQKLREILYEGT